MRERVAEPAESAIRACKASSPPPCPPALPRCWHRPRMQDESSSCHTPATAPIAPSARARRSVYIYGGRARHPLPARTQSEPFERPPSCGNRMRHPRAERSGRPYPCIGRRNRRAQGEAFTFTGQDASSTARRHTSRALLSVRRHAEIVCAVRVQGEASTFTGQGTSSTARPHTMQALLSVCRHVEIVCAVRVQGEAFTFTGQDASSTARRHTSRALLSVRRHAEIVCAVRVQGEASTFTGQGTSSTARPHTMQALLSVCRHVEIVCAVRVQGEASTFTGQGTSSTARPHTKRAF